MLATLTHIRQAAAVAGRPQARTVEPAMLKEMANRGFHDPVKSFCDPRLDYPELLLLDEFRWQQTDEGSRYLRACPVDDRYYQAVDYGHDQSRSIVTATPRRVHHLKQHADGSVTVKVTHC